MSRWDSIRELAPYRGQPPAIGAGGAGKRGELWLGFEREASGRSVLRQWERHAPLIVQQALYFDAELPQMPCLYILSSGGPQVDGDRYRQTIRLAPRSMAHISTGAATKIASMRHNFSAVEQHFILEEEAYLEWLPEPVIPSRQSRLWQHTSIEIAPSASLFYAETYLAGRRHSGERFDYDLLSLTTEVSRPTGERLYREKQLISPADRPPTRIGVMGEWEVVANLLILLPERELGALTPLLSPFWDREQGVALAVLTLPSGCGLGCRVLGQRSGDVKRVVRQVASRVRQIVKGVKMPEEFPWR